MNVDDFFNLTPGTILVVSDDVTTRLDSTPPLLNFTKGDTITVLSVPKKYKTYQMVRTIDILYHGSVFKDCIFVHTEVNALGSYPSEILK
jgi:hypothetical protein